MNNKEKVEYCIWFFILSVLAFGTSFVFFFGYRMVMLRELVQTTVCESNIGIMNLAVFGGTYMVVNMRIFALGILFGYIFTRKILDVNNRERGNK